VPLALLWAPLHRLVVGILPSSLAEDAVMGVERVVLSNRTGPRVCRSRECCQLFVRALAVQTTRPLPKATPIRSTALWIWSGIDGLELLDFCVAPPLPGSLAKPESLYFSYLICTAELAQPPQLCLAPFRSAQHRTQLAGLPWSSVQNPFPPDDYSRAKHRFPELTSAQGCARCASPSA